TKGLAGAGGVAAAPPPPTTTGAGSRPLLPSDVPERFFPVGAGSAQLPIEYRPTVLSLSRIHYVDAKAGLDSWVPVGAWAPVAPDGRDPWEGGQAFEGEPVLEKDPAAGARFAALPPNAANPRTYAAWRASLEAWLFRTQALRMWRCPARRESSRPGETEGDFRVRLAQSGREERDRAVEALRQKYASKVRALEDRVRTAEDRVGREKDQASQAKMQSTLSWGAAILGAVLGGRRSLGGSISKAGTAAKGTARIGKEAQDVARAEEGADVLRRRLDDLRREVEAEVERIQAAADPAGIVLEEVRVPPRKGDVEAGPVTLVWTPYGTGPDGAPAPAW
ncbi:MAG TPA: ATP-binding protein, partial [Planctomycetota bacterium]|nr:ATP-binding protein [Planctomycetota bacterium]